MIKFYRLPAAFGLRNPGPFALKVEMALTHLNLEFETINTLDLPNAPKQKAPWIEDDGIIPDSEIILQYLDQKTGGGLFGHLTPDEIGVGTAYARLAEDHLYWIMVASRWLDEDWFPNVKQGFFGNLKWPLSAIVPGVALRTVKKTYNLHGLGRHTLEEQRGFLQRNIDAIKGRLDTRDYIASDRLTAFDFAVASMLAGAMDNKPDTWVSKMLNQEPVLQAYTERVQSDVGVYCREI
jgi:glutathione S-transferase